MTSSKRAAALIFGCFVMQALVYVWSDGGFAVARFHSIGANTIKPGFAERARQLIFLLNYAVAVGLTLLIPFSKSKFIRYVLAPLLYAGIIFELIYTKTAGRPPAFSDVFALNMAAFTNVGDAATEFGDRALNPLLWASGLIALSLWFRFVKQRMRFVGPLLGLGLGYLTAAYGIILYYRGEPAVIGFPKGYNYLLASAWMGPATWTQKKTLYPRLISSSHSFQKIVVLIDESIWADAMRGLVLPKGRSAMLLDHSYSTGNCSAASNFYLRKAVRLNGALYPTTSLFELAKNQKFTTTYMDTQGVLRDPTTRNYFDARELSFVDYQEALNSPYLPYERDDQAMLRLKAILARPGRDFVIINKYGAHFPYEANLPRSLRSQNRFENYRKAVDLHSKKFLMDLDKLIKPSMIVFYTSDHGQYVTGPATHCNSGEQAKREEWEVPVAVLSSDTKLIAAVNARMADRAGRPFTHTEFTESVREAIGYDFPGVDSYFKPAKSIHPSPTLCFNYGPPLGFFGRATSCQEFSAQPR